MNDIPRRVYDVWRSPLTIKDCAGLMKKIKLECSTCERTFVNEQRFANHIEKCLVNAKHDVNYQLHMHANRLLILQHRVAMFCGTSEQDQVLECGLCKAEFKDEEEVTVHVKQCENYKKEYQKFMTSCSQIFSTMLHSYEELGHLFQQFVMDGHVIQIRKSAALKNERTELYFDDLTDHFIEKYREYIFTITKFADDAFNRWLIKREKDERNEKIEQIRQLLESEGTSEDDLFGSDSELGNEEDVDMDSDEEDSESGEESDVESDEDSDAAEEEDVESSNDEIADDEDDEIFYEDVEFEQVEYQQNPDHARYFVEDNADDDEDEIIDVVM